MSEDMGHHGERVIEEIRSLALPPGWARTSIGEVGEVRLGRQRSPKNRSAEYPTKYIRAANLTWTGLDLGDVLDMDFKPGELASYRLQPGDVLLSEASGSAGEVGKPAIWNGELEGCCFQNTVIRFRPKAVSSKFALVAFQHFARNSVFARVSKGVGIHHLSADRFASMPFLLPPEREQGRIVAKAEELLSDLDAGVAALKRAKANLKRYRAAVLKAAVEGKLTEEWRAKHPVTEPGSKLLERILTERRQKWEADQLAKFAAAEKEPPKNWQEKYVEPSPSDRTGLPIVPESWTWATLEAIADVVGGITKDQKKANQPGMRQVPYLRVANVQRGFLDLSEMKPISASEEDIAELRLEAGDVLFTEGGDRDKLGRGWVWSGELGECIHQNHIFRGRIFTQEMQPKLVSHHGNSFGKVWFTKAGKQTTNLASINLGILRRFPIPIAPAAEQVEIANLLDERLSQMDAAESQIHQGLLRAARLRQSILKQAFEGKLVPQDPKDEPASVLLERLRASRSAHEGNGKAAAPARTRGRRAKSKKVEGRAEE